MFHICFTDTPTPGPLVLTAVRGKEKTTYLDFTFKVGVGYFLLSLVEPHHLGSFPSLWPAAGAATSAGGLPILPYSTLMRTGRGSRFRPADQWSASARHPASSMSQPRPPFPTESLFPIPATPGPVPQTFTRSLLPLAHAPPGELRPGRLQNQTSWPCSATCGCVTLGQPLGVSRLNLLLYREGLIIPLYKVVVRIQQDDVRKVVGPHRSSAGGGCRYYLFYDHGLKAYPLSVKTSLTPSLVFSSSEPP